MKKFLIFIVLLIIIAAGVFVWLYRTDTFEVKKLVSYKISEVTFLKDKLKLDKNYVIENLKRKEDKEDKEENNEEVECSMKDTTLSHEDRYAEAFIPPVPEKTEAVSGEEGTGEEKIEEFSYPSPNKQEYSQEELENLASIYSSMEAEEAVTILEQFEDDIIIEIFASMKTGKVAEIMAAFDPKRAGVISLKMLDGN